MQIKICGNRTPEHFELAASAGADFAGVILDVPKSPRSVSLEEAAQIRAACTIPLVAVFLDASADKIQAAYDVISPSAVQLHGREPAEMVAELKQRLPCHVWKVLHQRPAGDTEDEPSLPEQMRAYADAGADVILLDTAVSVDLRGGTGLTGDWAAARELVDSSPVPVFLAGGLRPDNVRDAVAAVGPAGVDVASGVESAPGEKSPEAVRAFVAAAKSAAGQ